ncbi:MAG: OPT family oligopeptide transporter [Myxococcaceae bacterium]
MTETDPELVWLKEVYQPGARQLTVRAVIAGMLLGAAMCISNLYIILKTGWSIGVTMTACILAYAIFTFAKWLRITSQSFTPLENNAMGSVASAAGYMTGGGNMAAFPALLMITSIRPNGWALVAWFAVIAALGVCAAIPIKRTLINVEKLPFPTGTATAETILSLHAHGEEGMRKGRRLGWASLISALIPLLQAKLPYWSFRLPDMLPLPLRLKGVELSRWSLGIPITPALIGAGALMSFRIGWSLLLGAVIAFGVLAPQLFEAGLVEASYSSIVKWTLWPGTGVLISSGLLSFAFQWRTLAKSLKQLAGSFKPKRTDDPLDAVEVPMSWFVIGFVLLGPIVVVLMKTMFDIPIWAGLLALPLSVVMGVIAARVTGETDVTPTKALGPLTQLIFGALIPGQLGSNIMSANVTGGVGLHSADLLVDLKSGYLLGANPRQQFIAQMFGVLAGAAAVVPVFYLLVPSPDLLGTPDFPVPSSQVWASVSKMVVNGIGSLPSSARTAAGIGIAVGVALTLLERFAPGRLKPFVPSASGLGIGMVVPGPSSVAMFLGATLAEVVRRRRGGSADGVIIPLASGGIAGESLMGVLVKILQAVGVIPRA